MRSAKSGNVENAVKAQFGDFGIADIEKECTGVSRPMIRVVLEKNAGSRPHQIHGHRPQRQMAEGLGLLDPALGVTGT